MLERGPRGFAIWGCLMLLTGASTIAVWGQDLEKQPQATKAIVAAKEPGSKAAPAADPKPEPVGNSSFENVAPFTESKLNLSLAKNIVQDQQDIWTSPIHLRLRDVNWLVPLAGFTAGSLTADRAISKAVTRSPSLVSKSNTFSNYGIAGMAGGVGGLYLWGKITHNDHMSETGILSGEAAVDAVGVATALKYAFGRQRPSDGTGMGQFWHGGTSFPSDHAAAAWAAASVIAHEYPGPLTKLFAYGLASAITVSRVTGKDHFPTDVMIGSAMGWLIGREIYRKHHDPDLGGAGASPLLGSNFYGRPKDGSTFGSPYVPLDSWVYPAFERLAALGYAPTEFLGMRPWTRMQCAQLVEDAGDMLRQKEVVGPEAEGLYQSLETEFAGDIRRLAGQSENTVQLESVYTRAMDISGPPLNDSYHFGQTLINDFGRPYGEGPNVVTGFSGWASTGRLAFYVRAEYQHVPAVPAYSQQVRDAIALVDSNPVQPPNPIATLNQFHLLDTYALLNVDDWNLSFGKQSLWWGPDWGGSLIFSDNADPVLMFRATRTIPEKLPLLGFLGPVRLDLFFGKLVGHQFPPGPFIHGERISFKPTPRLEIGVSRTVVLGGVGHPLTFRSLLASYTNIQIHPTIKGAPGVVDPGDRHAAVDFSYRLSNWLTLYNQFYWDDAIRRTAYNPGIYLPRVPGVPKLDLRAEYVSTDVSPDTGASDYGQLIYFEQEYHDSYTNNGDLLGSWVGRQGTGEQIWGTYWLSPQSSVQVGYRHGWINPRFVPQGGNLDDYFSRVDLRVRSDLDLSVFLQYENWNIPLLSLTPRTDVSTSFQLTFHPRWARR
jgi:Capsule assembly protein Wzi/PAP2 superfamily